MISFLLKCRKIIDHYTQDEMTVYAAQASYFIVLSAFPFIMLLFTLIQFVPNVGKSDVLDFSATILPKILSPLVTSVVNDLYTKSPGTMLSVTAVASLWSSSRGMMSIERGLNRVFHCSRERNYLSRRLICSAYTIVFILVCIMSLVLLVLGTAIQNILISFFPPIGQIFQYLISFRALLSLALLVLCFAGLYSFIPNKKQHLKNQLPGALFTTVCWIAFSYGFSIYFNYFSHFSYMYGSLTAMVLLMLWLYFCICIVFLGAEINEYLSEKRAI